MAANGCAERRDRFQEVGERRWNAYVQREADRLRPALDGTTEDQRQAAIGRFITTGRASEDHNADEEIDEP